MMTNEEIIRDYKQAEPYGVPIEQEIAKARNLKRSFHARTTTGRREQEKKDEQN